MSWDLAIDFRTGDLVWTGNNDLGSRGGEDIDKQRIHVRLFIERGEFIYDPTHGGLGSRLLDVVHLPRERAIMEAPLYVREALAPMEDIEIVSVEAVEQAAAIVEDTYGLVNLVPNPSFEPNIAGWGYQGSTISRDSTVSKFGGSSLKVVTAGAGAYEGVFFWPPFPGFVAGKPYTYSFWVNCPVGKAIAAWIDWRKLDDTANGSSISLNVTGTGNWQQVSLTDIAPANTVKGTVSIYSPITQSMTFWVDGVQVEQNTQVTNYCDGDQPGCQWVGAPHNSASQRRIPGRKTDPDPRVLKLDISYKPTFDIGEEALPEETVQENVIIDVPT